jgi:hypothetical protein
VEVTREVVDSIVNLCGTLSKEGFSFDTIQTVLYRVQKLVSRPDGEGIDTAHRERD